MTKLLRRCILRSSAAVEHGSGFAAHAKADVEARMSNEARMTNDEIQMTKQQTCPRKTRKDTEKKETRQDDIRVEESSPDFPVTDRLHERESV
jgi:hypothetical protein